MIVNVIFFDVSYVSSVDGLLFLSLTFSSRRPDFIACCNLSRCQIHVYILSLLQSTCACIVTSSKYM